MCGLCYSRHLRRKHGPHAVRATNLRRRYGLSSEDYERLWKGQRERCAICEQKPNKRPNVDHDHATGKVRGLLCAHCNLGLGHFTDDPVRLQRAIDYLGGQR